MYFGPSISVGRRGISYGDSDAQAFISATGLTGTTEVNAVNNLVANLKTYGLWSKMKAIYPFVSDTVNLLSYSEDLSNGVYTNANLTVAVNSTTAPDGTNTADKLTATTFNGAHDIKQTTTDSTSQCTYSVYLKANGLNYVNINVNDNVANGAGALFDVSNGTIVGDILVGSGWSVVSKSITSAGNGWYRCVITINATGSTRKCEIGPRDTNSTAWSYTFIGNNVNGIYAWGLQFQSGTSATTYQQIATTPANRFVSQFKYNLKDPRDLDAAFRLAFNGTWAYSKTGALPNGTNAYANTYAKISANFTPASVAFSYYSRSNTTAPVNFTTEIGVGNGATNLAYYELDIKRLSGNAQTNMSDGFVNYISVGNADSSGYYVANRNGASLLNLWKGGTKIGTNTTTSTFNYLPTNNIFIAAAQDGTSPIGNYSNRECAFATLSDGLTDTEATNLYTSVQLFNQDLSRQVGVPIVSDSDAQSFLNAAQITDLTQANAINTLVVGLKNASLWTKMKAIYPFVGGTATSHKWNLKDPRDLDAAYRLAFFGAWTHSSTGALPNGTNAYADTKLIPNSHLSIESNHMSFYSRTQANTYAIEMGCEAVTAKDLILYHGFLARKTIVDGAFGTNEASSNITNTLGYQIGSRTSLSNLKLYWNNSLLATNTATKTDGQNSISIIIGATNKTTIGGYSSKQAAFSTIGDGLNDSEASTLYTLVQNFQTTLGRQV